MRRFELIEGNSSKFWEISREGIHYTVRYGRIGSAGQSTSKTAVSEIKAQTEVDKLIKEKTGKGYVECGIPTDPVVVADASPSLPESPIVSNSLRTATIVEIPAQPCDEPDGIFLWTPAWRRNLPIQRGFDFSTSRSSLKTKWTRIHANSVETTHSYTRKSELPHLKDLATRFPLETLYSPDSLAIPELDRWTAAMGLSAEIAVIVDLCIDLHGIEFALDAFMAAMRAEGPPANSTPQIDELVGAVAGCPEDQYQRLLNKWKEPLTTHPFELLLLASIFRIDSELIAAAMKTVDLHDWRFAAMLARTGLSLEQADQLISIGAFSDHTIRLLALNLARQHGVGAIPRIAQLYDRAGKYAFAYLASELKLRLAEILVAFRNEQCFVELLKRIEQKEVRPFLDSFAGLWPMAALRSGLKRTAITRNRAAEAWLTRLLAAHPELLEGLSQQLQGAAKALFERLSNKLVSLDEASLDDLPAVLRDPPWLKSQAKAQLPALPDVTLPPAAMVWPTGLREQWRNPVLDQPPHDEASQLRALQRLGIPPALFQPLLNGQIDDVEAACRDTRADRSIQHHLLPLAGPLRVQLWNQLPAFSDYSWPSAVTVAALVAHYELAVLPGLLKFTAAHLHAGLVAALPLAAAPLARFAAQALDKKMARPAALGWLQQHAELATTALLQQALARDTKPKEREQALAALHWLASQVGRKRMQAGAESFGDAGMAALQSLVDTDPLAVLPQKPRPMPSFFMPGGYARPRLQDGRALPISVLGALGTMLQVSSLEHPYPGLAQVKAACSMASLDEFAWDLFQSWLQSGAPSKENWAYTAIGLLGGELCVRRLTPLIRQWPGESQHARAVTGLDVLGSIGSDLALMNLNGIAQKLKFKGLQDRARDRIQALAEARGLSTEELADRLVPDLDLDEQGTTLLDFGPRQFTVGFDEQLRPFVRAADGARLKDLPRPLKSDDAERARGASERWKGLKNDVKAIASNQLQRLEHAMCSGRKFPAAVFRQFFVEHPLLQHLVRRLLWGVCAADGTVTGFRIAEDLSYADREDQAFVLAEDALVCLPHPLVLSGADQAGFGQQFTDYEILQPFVQLGREVCQFDETELASTTSLRFKGKRVATGSLYGLQHRGWRSGAAQDAGWISWFEKPLPGGLTAHIELEPGTVVGEPSYEPKQTLGELSLHRDPHHRSVANFSSLSAVVRSELLRDLDRLAVLTD